LIANLISTFFGAGYWPKGPGTAGSIAALLVAVACHHYWRFTQLDFLVLAILSLAPAMWAANETARQHASANAHKVDPQIIVIDEVVGQWLTLAGATAYNAKAWLLGLLLFRLFDIWKPWPTRPLEHVSPPGAGIVLDDVMAGVYGAVVMYLLGWFNLY
jgi:phosphatidylglycerophosphatase A